MPGTAPPAADLSLAPGAWLELLLLGLIWGSSFFFIAIGVAAIPPLSLSAVRIVLAALTLWLVMALRAPRAPIPPGLWPAFAVMGVLNNVVPFTLIIWSQQYLSAGLAAIVIATTPLMGVLVAGLSLADERLTAAKLAGSVTGLAGVVLIVGSESLRGAGDKLLPLAACLLAALSLALAGVWGRRFARAGVAPLTSASAQLRISTVFMIPLAVLFERPWQLPMPNATVWAAVIALAVLSTAVAYVLYFRILASAGATNMLLVNLLVPLPAIALGVTFLDETLAGAHVAGLALVGLGLTLVDGRAWQRWRRT